MLLEFSLKKVLVKLIAFSASYFPWLTLNLNSSEPLTNLFLILSLKDVFNRVPYNLSLILLNTNIDTHLEKRNTNDDFQLYHVSIVNDVFQLYHANIVLICNSSHLDFLLSFWSKCDIRKEWWHMKMFTRADCQLFLLT